MRVDRYEAYRSDPDNAAGPTIQCGEYSITVKEVVLDVDVAIREVDRLNDLNREEGCQYSWQGTHLFLDRGSFGEAGPDRDAI